MQKVIIIIFITLFASLSAEVFNVIEQNENYIIIEFDLPDYEITQDEINGNIYHHILLPQADYLLTQGLPKLPFYSSIVGIPLNGDISYHIIKAEKKRINDLHIFPVEKISYQNDQLEYEFHEKKLNKNLIDLYPESFFSKGNKAFYRDRHLISFKVFPFQWEIDSGDLIITTKATMRIDITGDRNQIELSNINLKNSIIDKGLILNNDTSSNWRRSKPVLDSYPPRSDGIINQIQIVVNSEGLYKIDYELLISSLEEYSSENELELEYELDWDLLDPRNLELNNESGPVPLYFYGENDGSFDPGDYFEFYGEIHLGDTSYYDDYTSENVYLLELKDSFGSRMAVENGGLENSDPDQYIVPVSYKQGLHLEKQNFIDHLGAQFDFNSINYYREDIWFWEKISSPNLRVIPFDLQYPEETTIRSFSAQVSIFGSTFNPDNYYQNESQS